MLKVSILVHKFIIQILASIIYIIIIIIIIITINIHYSFTNIIYLFQYIKRGHIIIIIIITVLHTFSI